ncbi:MAG TPA: copper resistance protein CopC [Actinophytocola sp.]|uniref:copper resistance CopC/CopD family protein n=1 Tax=Actinophytocola sp. TaxID=1872138 RepID=UPI002DBBAF8D|nr:copper resistance protein CopC [Actinophytocola sp.]HEU5475955.1 copper resistance protein CopC [Actinophytocola sp.]
MDSRVRTAEARAAAVLAMVAGFLLLLTGSASAHAELIETNPANGAHLDRPPPEVVLRFSESVNPVRGGFSLLDGGGRKLAQPTASTFDGDGARVRVPLPDSLGDGVYVLNWRVVSTDSHPIHGTFVFSAGAARAAPLAGAGAQAGADPVVGVAFWVFRLLGYLSLAVLIGGAFFVLACWPGGRGDARVHRLITAGWIAAVGSAVLALLLQGPNVAGSGPLTVFDPTLLLDTLGTSYGVLLLARVVLLTVSGYVLIRLIRSARPDALSAAYIAGFGGLALALAATWSGAGHPAAAGPLAVPALLLDATHLVAVSVWLGGLVVLAGLVLGRRTQVEADEAAGVVSAYSRAAAIAVVVLGVSGLLQAVREVVASGVGTEYFSLLVFKVAAFGLVVWVAAMSRAAVRARLAGRGSARRDRRDLLGRLRQSVRWEVAIAAVVLGLTAALVATPPGGQDLGPVAAAESAPAGPYLDALAVPGGDVQVWVDPARTGNNQIVVNVRDGQGINRDIPEVQAQLRLPANNIGPLEVALARTAAGQFVADRVLVPVAGTWQLSLRVRSSEFEETTVDTQIQMR